MQQREINLLVVFAFIICVLFSPDDYDISQVDHNPVKEIIKTPEVKTVKAVPSNAIACLATNIYMEARGEPIQGQIAVAQVTFNRAKYDQDKVCQVVMAKSQFSWTLDGKVSIEDETSFKKAVWVAKNVLDNNFYDHSNGADHYHADYAKSVSWADQDRIVTKIGKHIFYKLKGKKL
jgi:spore germination cell wall hydrolase CwlJ-like protein